MKARDVMRSPLPTVDERTELADVARLMLDQGLEAVPVVGPDGAALGLIAESDFIPKKRNPPFSEEEVPNLLGRWVSEEGIDKEYRSIAKIRAGEVMHSRLLTVGEDQSLNEIIPILSTPGEPPVLVVRSGAPVGLIGARELLKLVANRA